MTRPPLIAVSFVLALFATPASAQFGNIFRDDPPRPREDIPQPGNQPQYPQQPQNYPQQQPQNYPQQQPQNYPQQQPRNFPTNRQQDTIQSQPLEPLRGTEVPAQQQQGQQPQQPQQGQVQTLPGLPQGQRQPRGGLQQPSNAALQPGDEVVVAPPAQKINNPTAVFSGLDKITGRIISFDVAVNETVQFGALQVTPKACYTRPPTETPNTDAFVMVDEVTLQGETKRIFNGWMFAASPGLHGVEHPVYDVWLTDCKGGANPAVAEQAEKPQQPAKPQQQPAQQQRSPQRPQQPGFNIFR